MRKWPFLDIICLEIVMIYVSLSCVFHSHYGPEQDLQGELDIYILYIDGRISSKSRFLYIYQNYIYIKTFRSKNNKFNVLRGDRVDKTYFSYIHWRQPRSAENLWFWAFQHWKIHLQVSKSPKFSPLRGAVLMYIYYIWLSRKLPK